MATSIVPLQPGLTSSHHHHSLKFIQSFHQAILNNDTPAILNMYESGWNRITQQYYSSEEWPEGEVVAGLVGGGASKYLILLVGSPTNPEAQSAW